MPTNSHKVVLSTLYGQPAIFQHPLSPLDIGALARKTHQLRTESSSRLNAQLSLILHSSTSVPTIVHSSAQLTSTATPWFFLSAPQHHFRQLKRSPEHRTPWRAHKPATLMCLLQVQHTGKVLPTKRSQVSPCLCAALATVVISFSQGTGWQLKQ